MRTKGRREMEKIQNRKALERRERGKEKTAYERDRKERNSGRDVRKNRKWETSGREKRRRW